MEVFPSSELLIEDLMTNELPQAGNIISIPNSNEQYKVRYVHRSFKNAEEHNTVKVERII
jgi:hypothetical protein